MRFDPTGDISFQLSKLLNGELEFGTNIRGSFVEFVTTGDVQEVQHNLGYVPNGFIIIFQNGEGDVWSSDLESWTTSTVLLQSSVPNLTIRAIVL